MTTRNTQAPVSASKSLVESLKAAADDAVRLREIVESNDSASIAAAFAALLTGPSSDAVNDAKPPKKTHSRPCPSTPNETLLEILLFADRDALDAMQLVCRFMLEFIQEREAKQLPLRTISEVTIGKCCRPKFSNRWEDDWQPTVKLVRYSNAGKALVVDAVNHLLPYVRLAYCESFCVDLRWARYVRKRYLGTAFGAIFDDLVLPDTLVGVLTVCVDDDRQPQDDALRAFKVFKPLSKVFLRVDYIGLSSFNEEFFVSAAAWGVRSLAIKPDAETDAWHGIDLARALSFGFAEPMAGGARSLSGVCCYDHENFLAQVVKKASELDGRQHIDFKFSIDMVSEDEIDSTGFEKYKKGNRSWVIDDLENGITVEVETTVETAVDVLNNPLTEIHVFSSS